MKLTFQNEFMQYSKYFRLWQTFLVPIYVFVVFHFLKDITQDLLGIATPLDFFGDVTEDISRFSVILTWFYHWFMVNTFFLEFFLLLYVPSAWRRKSFSRLDLYLAGAIVYLFIAFTTAILLDPRF